MSAIAPREYDAPEPAAERARNVTAARPQASVEKKKPALARFAFMWDGWHSMEVDDGFVLA